MKIGNREIGGNNPTYIIAEAGTNHMGDVARAKELVMDASEAGADAIKFQAFVPDEPLFCPYEGDEKRVEYWNKTALTYQEWGEVALLSHAARMHFILSVFQEAALPFLDACDAAKVASRAAATYPYDKVDLPLIISDGMVDRAEQTHIDAGDAGRPYVWLSCIPEYPTPLKKAIHNIYSRPESFGISDHSGTVFPALAAMGSVRPCPAIEVHFSSEKIGRDAVVELTVDELKLLCDFRDAVAL